MIDLLCGVEELEELDSLLQEIQSPLRGAK
jgi:hypothetical protein